MSLFCHIFVLFVIGTLPRKNRFLSGMAFNIYESLTRVACHVSHVVGLFTPPLEKGVTKKGVNYYRYTLVRFIPMYSSSTLRGYLNHIRRKTKKRHLRSKGLKYK